MKGLDRHCDEAIINAEIITQGAQQEFASLGLVNEDQFMSHSKELVKPGLECAKKICFYVEVEKTKR